MAASRKARAVRPPRNVTVSHADRSRVGSGSILLLALALACVASIAYSTSFSGVFVFDDHYAITGNPNIKSLWPLTSALSAPAESPVSGRPVAALSFAVNYALAPADVRNVMGPGGAEAAAGTYDRFLRNIWGYHFVNLALHVLTGLALFGVVRRTLLSDRLLPTFGADSTPIAFVASLIWLVHPVLSDAVTYVAQRTELLMGLFYLLTLYCAVRAADRDSGTTRQRWWTLGAVAACALGMGSKQTMLLAPIMVWLWDWTFLREAPGPAQLVDEAADSGLPVNPDRRVRTPEDSNARRWLYAGLAATWVVLVVLVALERWPTSVGIQIQGWTPWTYLLTQARVIVHYIRLSVVPLPLVSDYDGWPMARSLLEVAPYAALLAIALGFTAFAIIRRQGWGFIGAWFFAALAPSSSLLPLPTEVVAERRLYLPLAAVVIVLVVGIYLTGRWLLPRLVRGDRSRHRAGWLAAALLVAGIVIPCTVATYERNRVYGSEESFWQDVVDKRPDNPRARLNYGVVLSTAHRYLDAERQLREAVRLRDGSAAAHANLGSVLCSLGRPDEGVVQLERALALDPGYTDANRNLGEGYGALGRLDRAAEYFSKAVDAAPDSPFLLTRLGWLLATAPDAATRNGKRAVEVSERAVRLTSSRDPLSLDALAAAYAESGRFDEAVRTVREALDVARSQGDQSAIPDMAGRLALYQSGKTFHESR